MHFLPIKLFTGITLNIAGNAGRKQRTFQLRNDSTKSAKIFFLLLFFFCLFVFLVFVLGSTHFIPSFGYSYLRCVTAAPPLTRKVTVRCSLNVLSCFQSFLFLLLSFEVKLNSSEVLSPLALAARPGSRLSFLPSV